MSQPDIRHGDCLDVLRALPDESVDAIVTDPPYGLEFMGKDWDRPWAVGLSQTGYTDGAERLNRPAFGDSRNANCRTCKGRQRGEKRCTCTAPDWDRHPREDMRAFQQWCEAWADECLRVLKPGGHLAAFGGTRTYHRMACAIEDAGFEIRDSLTWLYGSGFPKSLDVGKAIDKARDDRADILTVTSWLADQAAARGFTRRDLDQHMGTSDMAGWWLSRLRHRCQCPTWEQWDQIKRFIGLPADMDAEVWRLNGRKGTPGEAWEQREVLGSRHRPLLNSSMYAADAGGGFREDFTVTAPATDAARQWQGWGTALKPAQEPIVLARRPLSGTVAANAIAHGTGALNIDATRVGMSAADREAARVPNGRFDGSNNNRHNGGRNGTVFEPADQGRWPANVLLSHGDCGDVCTPGCPVAELDAQSGTVKGRVGMTQHSSPTNIYGEHQRTPQSVGGAGTADRGGASRYFPTFRYQAKAPASERPKVDGVSHPTVKPLELMRWLVRLVTPPGGTVLDPFAGSGTTVEAALLVGFDVIGIEREADYLPLIQQRIDRAQASLTAQQALAEAAPSLFDLVGDDDAA